jgi:hypothetical protein
MTLQLPTWSVIDSIDRDVPNGRARHIAASTVARFGRRDWLSFDSSIPTPVKAARP